jgi:capsid protein
MTKISPAAREIAAHIKKETVSNIQASMAGYLGADYRSGGAKSPGGLSKDGRGTALNHWASFHGDTIGRSIVERYSETAAGVGLVCESSVNYELLGIPMSNAEAWGSDVDQRFHLWMNDKKCHRSETMTGYQSQGLYVVGQQRDGENFVRFYYDNANRELQNPLQFEFIDPEQINADAITTTRGYITRNDGIVRDSKGRETGYKVSVWNGKKHETIIVPAKGGRSGRTAMIHGYRPEYAGQGRGYSRLGHALQDMQKLTDFSLAQIMKAINQSLFFMFVKPSSSQAASNPIEDLTKLKSGPFTSAYGSNPTPQTDAQNVTVDGLSPVDSYSVAHADFHEPGGVAVFGLNKGEDLKPFVNTAPADSYDKFVDSFSAYLSASTGVPLEIVLMRFNRNYTASRGALIMFWQNAIIWRREMESDFLNPLRESWLAGEVAAGRVAAPGWSDPVLKAAWLNCNWHGAPLPDTDPVKTAKANHMNAQIGAKTLDRIAREHGGDGRRNRAQLTRELSELPAWPVGSSQNAANAGGSTNSASALAEALTDVLEEYLV